MSVPQAFLAEFDNEMANTRKLLERIPEDGLDYRPHPKSMKLRRLAGHIAELPGLAALLCTTDETEYKPYVADSRTALLEMFDKNVSEARARLTEATDEQLARNWTFTAGGKTIFSRPRQALLRSFFLYHLIHHRAQLSLYLRLKDIEIPGMYGPSWDDLHRTKAD